MALGADVAQLIVSLRLDDKGFSGRLNAASGQLRAMDAGLSQMGRGAGQLGTGLLRLGERAALVAGGGLFAVTKWAIDTETAFAGVQKTVDETATTSYAALRAQLEAIARIKPQSFEDLSQIAEFGGQLGVSADNMREFADTVADFLTAVPQMGLEEAAFGLQRISVLTKAADEDFDNIASTIVELGNNFATTESAIVATSERFAAQATTIGLSTQATLGLATALTALGGEPEEAGTSMQRLFQRINLALAEGGEKAELFAEVTGTSAEKFRENWTRDAEGTLLDFLESMGELSDDAIEQTRILDELGLADARLGKNILNLANNFDRTRAAIDSANAEWETNTALTEEAAKRYETVQAQLAVLRNNLQQAGVTIGNEVLPVVKELSTEFVEFLNQPGTQAGLRDFAKDLAEGIRSLVSELKGTDFSGIIGGLKLAAEVAKGAFDAFRALPEPVQQLAIAALVANKVSGGAIGSIAAGMGNLLLGSLKTITAANVTVIGANVAAPGVGGGGVPPAGRGLLGGLKTAGALAAIPLAGAAAVEVINFQNMRGDMRAALGDKLDALPRATGREIDASISRIEGQIQQDRPLLEGILFHTNIKPQLDAEIAELRALRGKADSQLQRSADTLAAVRATQDPLRRIAGKNFSPTLVNKITVPLSVSVGVSETQYRTRSFTQTVGGYDNSAGI